MAYGGGCCRCVAGGLCDGPLSATGVHSFAHRSVLGVRRWQQGELFVQLLAFGLVRVQNDGLDKGHGAEESVRERESYTYLLLSGIEII